MANGDAVLSQTSQAIEEKQIDASRKLRVGIIGTGWIAEAHVRQYVKFPDVELVAMARCNGCDEGINKGFNEKLDRIVSEGAEVCHLGVCTKRSDTKDECPTITEAAAYLEERGVRIVRGTH